MLMEMISSLVLLLVALFAVPSFASLSPIEELHQRSTTHRLVARANSTNSSLPLLKLPYGTWRAQSYDQDADLYIFKNIRFAAPPTGPLRFAKPAKPEYNGTLQDGSYGPTCLGSGLKALANVGAALTGTPADALVAAIQQITPILQNDPSNPLNGVFGLNGAEDCLFLDLYVPSKALAGNATKLPVVNYIYGGGYVGGSKEGLYSGIPVVKGSGGNVIYVSGNYRLAAFGFLAGRTVEEQGTPNAAFWDQRAVLEWIQEYIYLVGGDPCDVSAWGESAGAGSIEHHLTQFGGTRDPLFKKAVIQSPAFQPLYDRKGTIEQTYKQFEAASGCAGRGLSCLRNVSASALNNASTAIINAAPPGTFGFGPAPDGTFVRQLPALEFASGNYWKGLESVLITHTKNEAQVFTNPNITTNAQSINFLLSLYPNAGAAVANAIIARFPAAGPTSIFATEFERLRQVIQDSAFVCNARYLADAYAGKAYVGQYSRGKGYHGSDIAATFYDPNNFVIQFLATGDKGIAAFAPTYESYLTSHARTGNPNTYSKNNANYTVIEWPKVQNDAYLDYLNDVLYAGDNGYSLFLDNQTAKCECGFWTEVFAGLTNEGGYAPPGSVVPSTLRGVRYNLTSASANYKISGSGNFTR